MADVDQHGHPWVPALVHILLLREGKQKLTCLYSGFRGSPLIAHLLKVYSLIGDSKNANVSEVLDLIIPGQSEHLLLNSSHEEIAHTTPKTAIFERPYFTKWVATPTLPPTCYLVSGLFYGTF